MDESEQRRVIVQGIAAHAVTMAEMGASEDEIRGQVVGLLHTARAPDLAVVREAAAEIARGPLPLEESAEETEQAEHVRQMLGIPSAADNLAAALRAREVLERLADHFDSSAGEDGPSDEGVK